MPANSIRRWFRPRYSLATLFVVVTVFGVWLAVQINWIKERHEMLATRRLANGGYIDEVNVILDMTGIDFNTALTLTLVRPAPWSLRLLGERGVSMLIVSGDDETRMAEYEAQTHRMFPEAKIRVVPAVNRPQLRF